MFSQTREYEFSRLTVRQYLSCLYINSLNQDMILRKMKSILFVTHTCTCTEYIR